MKRAVLLDRDGVIIEDRPSYVRSWADVSFISGACKSLSRLAQSEYTVILVTNQSAVGRGIVTEARMHGINRRLCGHIEACGGRIDGVYACPHAPGAGCSCRKPRPGMLVQAALDHNLDLQNSWMVGDSLRDMAAAVAAGTRGVLVLTGHGASQAPHISPEIAERTVVLSDLSAAVEYILTRV